MDRALTKIERVIAIVEPDAEQQPAVDRVRQLAEKLRCEVLLVACDYSQYLVEGYYFSEAELPALRQEYLDERKALLDSLAAPLRESGLTVLTQAVWSHPSYKAIVEIVARYQPDLVVHHARRHAALSRMILTNDDWQLARHCEAPLLVIKGSAWKEHPTIIAAVDPMHARHKPSGLDHNILGAGKLLKERLGGELYAVHAVAEFPLSGIYPGDAQVKHREAFDGLVAEFDIPADHALLIDEAPEFALQKVEADKQADLVIVGAVSRSLLSDIFIGSVTEKVVDFLDCDVLLLRPDNSN